MSKTVFIIEKISIILINLFDKWNEFRYLLSLLKFKMSYKDFHDNDCYYDDPHYDDHYY